MTNNFDLERNEGPRYLALLLLLALAAPGFAQVPRGDDFVVSSPGILRNAAPHVGLDHLSDFVVVWQSHYFLNAGDTWDVRARRYRGDGLPRAPQFEVPATTADAQLSPRVAVNPSGNFVVVWSHQYAAVPARYEPRAQQYLSDGSPLGLEIDVAEMSDMTRVGGSAADVAIDQQGNFVIVWHTNDPFGTDDGPTIVARRYDQFGVPRGDAFQVNSYTTGAQNGARVASDPFGNFVVVWTGGSTGTDTGPSIQARRWLVPGADWDGDQFQVNEAVTADIQTNPAIAMNGGGDFVVVWRDRQDYLRRKIRGRRFHSTGTPKALDFPIDQWGYGYFLNQDRPVVGLSGQGDFVVVWESAASLNGDDANGGSIEGRFFYADETPLDQFQVNTFTTGKQLAPAVGMQPEGSFVVTWWSDEPGGATSVRARLVYTPQHIFTDGFESGDTSAWAP